MSQEERLWGEGRYEVQELHFAEVQCGASQWTRKRCRKTAERRGLGLWVSGSRGLPLGTSTDGGPPMEPSLSRSL